MVSEDDNEIIRLEYLYGIKAKPAKIAKVDKTIYLSKAVFKKIAVYKGDLSAMIEEDLIKRLRADGYLPPPLQDQGAKVGGGAQEYFNPTKTPTPQRSGTSSGLNSDNHIESPFKPNEPTWPKGKPLADAKEAGMKSKGKPKSKK